MLRTEDITLLNNFSLGLLTNPKELNGMDIRGTPDCMDVYADLDGSLHKRLGVTKLNTSVAGAGTKDCHGLFNFEGTAIASFGTTYYKMDELDGTWDSLQESMLDAPIECENYEGNLVICNWDYDFAKTMQVGGTSLSSLNTSSIWGRARHPKVYKDHLLMCDAPGYPYTFSYSEVADMDDFANGGTWVVNTHDGDDLMGWGELVGRLYAFKRGSIHQMTYRGGSPYWVRRQLVRGIGTRSPMTIKNVTLKDGNEVLMFLGSDRKLYKFDGYNADSVSDNFELSNDICPIAMATLNLGGMDFAHAVVDTARHWYVLFVANGGTSTITHGLIYNYFTGAVWPFNNQTYKASIDITDSNGRKWVVVGDYAGYAYRWMYGTKDDTTTISAYHTTPRLIVKPSELRKEFEVTLSMRAISDDTVSFQYRRDYKDDWSTAENIKLYNPSGEYYLGTTFALNTATLGPKKTVVEQTIGLDSQVNNIQFKISDSLTTEPWTLYSYDFLGKKIANVRV